MISDKQVEPLRKVLQYSTGKVSSVVIAEMSAIIEGGVTRDALVSALKGDNRSLNNLLFLNGQSLGKNLVWVAPVRAGEPKYVWMIGRVNKLSVSVHKWFSAVRNQLANDPLLQQHMISPPLLFVDPMAISSVTLNELDGEDEFAIFQTGYENAPDEIGDLEQRMVINMKYSITKRLVAQERLEHLFGAHHTLVQACRENLELFSVLHNEGHNQGHFVGSWPHEDEIKKHTVLYEAVEEFRACVAAVLLVSHLPLTETQKQAFALSVFATRFLGFGYDAYCLKEQRRETAREIVVGLLFFEWLLKSGAIYEDELSGTMLIKQDNIVAALSKAFVLIDERESAASKDNGDDLRLIAEEWYTLAFPDGNYSQAAKKVYNTLVKGGDVNEFETE